MDKDRCKRGVTEISRGDTTANLLQNKHIIVHGGCDEKENLLNDTYAFNTESDQWSPVKCLTDFEPTHRESHISWSVEDDIYLFGGQSNSVTIDKFEYDVFLNDLHCVSLSKNKSNIFHSMWLNINPKGVKTSKRSSSASCVLKERYLFLVGGEGYHKEFDEETSLGGKPQKAARRSKEIEKAREELPLLFS